MEWLNSLFIEQTALQAVVIISLISAIGLGLGKIHIMGVSLGVTVVFFAGILAGHFGLSVDPQMLNYAESFGLILFVYALGLQVGPGFFSSFRKGGVELNMLALGVVLLGTAMTVVFHTMTGVSLPDMVGILCGATTNTPALGAAQQTLKQMGMDSNSPSLSCAVSYPLGVIGVILGIIFVRKLFVKKSDLEIKEKDDNNKTYIAAFQVHNPGIFDKSIKDIAHISHHKFIISRLWRDGNVSIPTSEKVLKEGDRLLVITSEKDALALTVLFGEQENTDWNKEDIDWNAIDSQLVSQRIVVTRSEINGKKLGSLRLRNHYGINISRVYRSGVQLLATPELTLQMGDRLTVVGEAAAIHNVEKVLGNAVKSTRYQRGLTQLQVAEMADIDVRTVMNIENYKANPKMEVLFPLIRTLRVDARTIFNPELERDAPMFQQLRLMVEECSEQEAEALIPVVESVIAALRAKDAIEIG